ncbi:MAG: helix-hairpin-helix domain-containing protein, partial [Bacteroidota bacterium]
MDNKHIIALLKDTATLLELHGANPFQIKHYSNAALCLEKIPQAVAAQPLSALKNLTGATASAAKLIHEINTTGTLRRWEELRQQTPQGLWELLRLQGLGPKKVRQLWQGLGIDNAADLLQACEQGQIAALPGFGQKTQATTLASLAFQAQNKHKVHYATALPHATALLELIQQRFPTALASLTGPMRRKAETIDQVDILVGTDQSAPIVQWLNTQPQLQPAPQLSGPFAWRGTWIAPSLRLNLLFCPPKAFYQQLLL